MRKTIVTSALLAAAISVSCATASADAGHAATPIGYTATLTPNTAVIETDSAGTISTDHGVLTIRPKEGGPVLAGAELSFRVDDFVFPIAADIHGNRAVLTPQFDVRHAVYRPVALPFENQAPWKNEYDREQAAWSRLSSTILTGATIGTLVGGLGGAAVGCVLGGIAGATVAAAAIIGLFGGFLPAAAIGCLGGIVAIGALGTAAGQLFVTAPIAIMAAVQYFTTVNQPAPSAK
ncbi:hypothetical protein [Nocardia cerradoensis]|uniref:DUF8020 domain-containing protein n=1 Tax=Nocardia cerradoensis TaxID=85688 RepID=A0A231H029_9NOCA|nr:hypothetical protein [Nocardia cerradoensis]NKY41907.1 hypothetical protein [Nocardia cerradoensis]OXR42091.1 hypothetical protein B7C42_05690 [Nocardia cerradoensis]